MNGQFRAERGRRWQAPKEESGDGRKGRKERKAGKEGKATNGKRVVVPARTGASPEEPRGRPGPLAMRTPARTPYTHKQREADGKWSIESKRGRENKTHEVGGRLGRLAVAVVGVHWAGGSSSRGRRRRPLGARTG